jgi:hypothetical protein
MRMRLRGRGGETEQGGDGECKCADHVRRDNSMKCGRMEARARNVLHGKG